jgi:uncharacterized hydrophobic protein (TIGR00271 family)
MKKLLSEEAKDNIFNQVIEDTKVTPYYYIMILLACTIVTYGLLQNSTAVIIGAMLISPLMGPIIGGALAVSEGDNSLLKIAIRTEVLGALLTVAFAVFLALIIPEKLLTEEILSRTRPTLLDLIIALAAGAAGTYAICYRPNSAIIPGVAISTALMPPLCVVGIGISNKDYAVASGALLLFLANIIAINFASILVFNIFGFNHFYRECKKCLFHTKYISSNLLYSIALVCLISIPLAVFMFQSYQNNSVNNTVRSTIQEEMNKIAPQAEIESLATNRLEDAYLVDSVIRSTKALSKDNIRQIENILEYKLTKPVRLDADIVLVQRISNSDSINGYNDLISSLIDIRKEPVEIVKIQSPEQIIEGAADEKLSLLKGATLDNFSIEYEKKTSIYYIDLYIYFDGEMNDNFQKSMVSVLEDKLKRRVILSVYQVNPLVPDPEPPAEGGPAEESTKSSIE